MRAQILDQKHPCYDADLLGQYHALYEGGRAFEGIRDTLLPKAPLEGSERYRDRQRHMTYTNHVAPLIDMVVAWLFSRPAIVEGVQPPEWLDDVDGRGTDWNAWWRDPFCDALQDGRAFVWANLPRRPTEAPAPSNRLDEEKAGLNRPFLVNIEARHVINWTDDDRGNLASIMVRTEETLQPDLLGEARRVIRWTYIDAKTIDRWEWEVTKDKPAPGEKDDVPNASGYPIAHNVGAFPVVRLDLPSGMHAGEKMRDPAIALLRTEHDQDWSLRVSGHPILTVTTPEGGVSGPKKEPIVAAGAYIGLVRDGDGKDEIAYVEPPGGSYEAREKHIERQTDALHRVVQQMATAMSADAASKGGKSGAAKMADWKSMEVMLTAYADRVRTCMEQVADVIAVPAMLKLDAETLSVGGLAGWSEADIMDIVATFAAAFPEIKSPTFRKTAAKQMARRLLPDAAEDLKRTIDGEIDAADYDDVPIMGPNGQTIGGGDGTEDETDEKSDAG